MTALKKKRSQRNNFVSEQSYFYFATDILLDYKYLIRMEECLTFITYIIIIINNDNNMGGAERDDCCNNGELTGL